MASGELIENLGKYKTVLIKQREEWIECLPCCENINEYTVFSTDENFLEQKEVIGKFVEKEADPENKNTNLCCLFCAKCCRTYKVDLEVQEQSISSSKRDCKCGGTPCCCLHSFDIFHQVNNIYKKDQQIGTVDWPYGCLCNHGGRGMLSCIELDIKDSSGKLIYQITAPATQLGFISINCCGPCMQPVEQCQRREYFIYEGEIKDGKHVGSIFNIYNEFVNECFNKADLFAIKFPEHATVDQKLLLLQTVIFIDFLQYGS